MKSVDFLGLVHNLDQIYNIASDLIHDPKLTYMILAGCNIKRKA